MLAPKGAHLLLHQSKAEIRPPIPGAHDANIDAVTSAPLPLLRDAAFEDLTPWKSVHLVQMYTTGWRPVFLWLENLKSNYCRGFKGVSIYFEVVFLSEVTMKITAVVNELTGTTAPSIQVTISTGY